LALPYCLEIMKDILLIIFDLDGTLIDAYPAIIRSFNYAMRKMGYPGQDASTIRRAVGWGDANLLRPFIESKDLKKTVSLYRNHHKAALLKYSRLFPGASLLLNRLKKKRYKIAVASNRPTRFSLILIRHLKIKKYFDYVLCADKLEHIKPHPQILSRIMDKFSMKPAQTLFVGDMVIDAQAGRRAGVRAVIVTTGSSSRAEIKKEKPYRIIKEIRELPGLLSRG